MGTPWLKPSAEGQSYDETTEATSFTGGISAPSAAVTLLQARKIQAPGVQDPRSFATIGDSHNAYFHNTASSVAPFGSFWYNYNWILYWLQFTAWRFFPVGLFAVGGKRTDEIIAEQLPALLALRPGFCIEASGTNDNIQNIPLATTIANTKTIYDAILGAGIGLHIYIAPIYLTVSSVPITAEKAKLLLQLREWKYDYAMRNPGVVIKDHHQISVDYASATASMLETHSYDGIHTSPLGAYMGGKAFADADIAALGPQRSLVPEYDSAVGVSAGPATDDLRQLYRFPGLPGSSAETNPGMSGLRPGNGWYANRSASGSGVGSLETIGKGWQRYNVAKVAGADAEEVRQGYGFQSLDYPILAAPSDRRRLVQLSVFRKETGAAGVRGDNINFSLTIDGVATTVVAGANFNADPTKFPNGIERNVEWRTPPIVIPAGGVVTSGSITVVGKFSSAGTLTDGIGPVRILDVSRLYDGDLGAESSIVLPPGIVNGPNGTVIAVFSGFTPLYSAGVPATADLTIASSQSQRVAIPAGSSTVRLTFFGFGPFRYRLGNSSVAAISTDAPAYAGMQVLVPVGTNTHIAVYGTGAGSLVVEGGTGGD